jgi:hypothetical protein
VESILTLNQFSEADHAKGKMVVSFSEDAESKTQGAGTSRAPRPLLAGNRHMKNMFTKYGLLVCDRRRISLDGDDLERAGLLDCGDLEEVCVTDQLCMSPGSGAYHVGRRNKTMNFSSSPLCYNFVPGGKEW